MPSSSQAHQVFLVFDFHSALVTCARACDGCVASAAEEPRDNRCQSCAEFAVEVGEAAAVKRFLVWFVQFGFFSP
jgi:hypothetical protein